MSRRSRLITRYAAVSVVVVLLAAFWAWRATLKDAAPVVPGDRAIAGLTDALARRPPADAPKIVFRDVAAEAGVGCIAFEATRSRVLPEDMASGCAWFDLEGDGDQDLFVVRTEPLDAAKGRAGRRRGHALFRNDGHGRFEDVAELSGVAIPACGLGVAPGDYDGDGDVDLYVTAFGKNQLFRNRGDATFDEVAAAAGVAVAGFSTGASWADYDGDGALDLYVTEYVRFVDDPAMRGRTSQQYGHQVPFSMNPSAYLPGGGHLFRNRGDGTFEDVTDATGTGNAKGRGLSVLFADLDGDRRPDIYVANDVSDNVFYWNRGGGVFQDVSHLSSTADYRGAMGLAVGDYDGDADQDVFITHWIAQENALYENVTDTVAARRSSADDGTATRAVDPSGRAPLFMDVADRRGLGAVALDFVGWGCAFLDFDLDGRPDLFVANGHTLEAPGSTTELAPQRSLLFWNGGGAGFFDMAGRSGEDVDRRVVGRGLAVADYDQDGDEDVFVVVHGGKAMLLRNEQATRRHALTVRVKDGGRNRFAIGAVVAVTAGGRAQSRIVGAQPSYLSGNAYDLVFGLGAATAADTVTVTFQDGEVVKHAGVAADRVFVAERHETAPR